MVTPEMISNDIKRYIKESDNNIHIQNRSINSKNLNYNICGFSNNINTYDNYTVDNIKYTHKVANNSNVKIKTLIIVFEFWNAPL